MSERSTTLEIYELKDLAGNRSFWFEGIYEARATVEQLGLTKWVIVSGHDNIVDRSHPEEDAPVEKFKRRWREEFGTPRAPIVDVRMHPPYATILKALDDLPVDLAMNLIVVWTHERDTQHQVEHALEPSHEDMPSVRLELAELLNDEDHKPDYMVRAHDLPSETPTVKVYTGREW